MFNFNVNNVNVFGDININLGEAVSALGRILGGWFSSSNRDDIELISSCRKRDVNAVHRILRDSEIDINATDEYGRTLLIIASSKGDNDRVDEENFHLVKLLLNCEPKPEINAKDHFGNTALIMASRNGNVRIVRALIEAGADVNAKNNIGWTGLMRAAKHGYRETVNFLISKGADKTSAAEVVRDQIHVLERKIQVLSELERTLS
ncbi:MAG: ankyrin repeat domain-containing protein [Synergistaceae bacterium]|nr:ankyrin repeat domain-containing protein [Synergistaceae bacterium]